MKHKNNHKRLSHDQRTKAKDMEDGEDEYRFDEKDSDNLCPTTGTRKEDGT